MAIARGYAATDATKPLTPFTFERREPNEDDVVIDIKFAGICHSDIHTVRNEWKNAVYPIVPGHEIAGIVTAVGSAVTKFKVGDRVGVGCFVDSCVGCAARDVDNEQYMPERLGQAFVVLILLGILYLFWRIISQPDPDNSLHGYA